MYSPTGWLEVADGCSVNFIANSYLLLQHFLALTYSLHGRTCLKTLANFSVSVKLQNLGHKPEMEHICTVFKQYSMFPGCIAVFTHFTTTW